MKHLVAGVKRGLGLHIPHRSLVLLPDDIFLVSFPNPATRGPVFSANLRFPDEPATWANIDRLVPDPTGTTKRDFDRMPRPRIIKSHECFDPRYPRVVYIVRDPRDVVVSQYHYHRKLRKIADDSPIEKFVTRFLAGETCPHGSWGQNVATWLYTSEGSPRFLLLRYEDLLADAARELAKVVEFLHLWPVPNTLLKLSSGAQPIACGNLNRRRRNTYCSRARARIFHLSAPPAPADGEKICLSPGRQDRGRMGTPDATSGYELASQPTEVREYASLGVPGSTPR